MLVLLWFRNRCENEINRNWNDILSGAYYLVYPLKSGFVVSNLKRNLSRTLSLPFN